MSKSNSRNASVRESAQWHRKRKMTYMSSTKDHFWNVSFFAHYPLSSEHNPLIIPQGGTIIKTKSHLPFNAIPVISNLGNF